MARGVEAVVQVAPDSTGKKLRTQEYRVVNIDGSEAGVEAFLKGWVSRMLPQAETDNDPGIVRLGRFGDVWTIGAVRKQHGLADEGTYFVCNNAQTGLAATALAAPTATSPFIIIANVD